MGEGSGWSSVQEEAWPGQPRSLKRAGTWEMAANVQIQTNASKTGFLHPNQDFYTQIHLGGAPSFAFEILQMWGSGVKMGQGGKNTV